MMMSSLNELNVTEDETLDDEIPAIHEDKEQEFEGEADGGGAEHVHTKAQEDVCNHEVHDEEGDKEEEADDKRLFKLCEHKGRRSDDEVIIGQ